MRTTRYLKTASTLLCVAFIAISCVKSNTTSTELPTGELAIPTDFSWKTLTQTSITITQNSDILNSTGDTVGVNLPAGTYNFTVGNQETLRAIPVANNTKAAQDEPKIQFPNSGYGNFMAEDLFPYKGDMDMNDIVFGIRLDYFLNPQDPTRVKKINVNIQARACGSSLEKIGIALKINTSPNNVAITSCENGKYLSENSMFGTLNANGTEQGVGENIIVIPFTDNYRSFFKGSPKGFINTDNNKPRIDRTQSAHVVNINFDPKNMPLYSDIQALEQGSKLDIFVIFNERSKEIFQKGCTPTAKFNKALFNETSKTDFSSKENIVWALLIGKSIQHPTEYSQIFLAYPSFKTWVESNGANSPAWYDEPNNKELLATKYW